MSKKLLLLLIIPISLSVHSQDVKHSIKMDFKLPTPVANGAFRKTNDGVADVSFSYQYPIYKGIGIGIGASYTYYQVDEFALNIPNSLIKGRTGILSGFGKLFYEKYMSDILMFDVGIKAGYSDITLKSEFCKQEGMDRLKKQGLFLEPYMGFYMVSKPNFTVGLVFGYGIVGYEYNPSSLCLDEFPGFSNDAYNGVIQNISVGFGFSAILRHKGR